MAAVQEMIQNVAEAGLNLRLLIFAPFGRDAALVSQIAGQESISCHVCLDAQTLKVEIERGAGAAVLTEEAITPAVVETLRATLSTQSRWSDFPLIVLTGGGVTSIDSIKLAQQRAPLGNVVLLERPVRILTLVSTVKTALRARQRQYEIRDHLVQRQLAAEELRQSQDRLHMAVESAALGTWDFTPAISEFHWSERCVSLFGISNSTAVHYESFLSVIHPDDRTRVDELFRSALKPGGTGYFAAEFRVVTRDEGTLRWLMARGKAHFSDAWKPLRLSGTFLDITQAKLSEQTLRKTEKLVTAGRMAATIAHEINNPLAAATNLLYLANTDPELGEEARRYLEQAEQELARVAHITRQTLGFYRESASPIDVNIQKLIESVLLIYRKKFEAKQIKIEREFRGPAGLEAIEGELRQVLSNLLTNAADAVPMGGTIWVRTANSLMCNGERGLRISVADNGKGISPEHSHHIFEPFFTTKDSVGTGLGLWVAKQIIEKHGGRIAFRTRTDVGSSGTVFSIFLPLKLKNRIS